MRDPERQQLANHLFSMAALELGLLTSTQVGECYLLQSQSASTGLLARVCLDHGYLSAEGVQRVQAHQKQLQRRLHAEASLFGRIAVSMQLMTRDELDACIALQRQQGYRKKLGEIAIAHGCLREADVERVLDHQEQVKRRMAAEVPLFGRVAMDLGLITREQLEECIELQRAEGSVRRLGEIAVEQGYLQSADVKRVLEGQSRARDEVDSTAAEPVPASADSAASTASTASAEQLRGSLRINKLLGQMVALEASDLHLSASCPAFARIHGKMKVVGKSAYSDAQLRELLLDIIPAGPRKELEQSNDADFAHEVPGVARFRVNVFRDRKGLCAVFRQIPYEIVSPEQLGLPPQVLELCNLSKGLVLVTGPTGSGKSTTLATMLDVINRTRSDHVVTIEDPIEFVHENKKCLVNQREVGTHTNSFKNALRAALREDPDVVLVGELRDLETVSIAIETAETGHLVFGTLHTTSAHTTVDRVIEQFPGNQQAQIRAMLSESLRGVIAQMLCAREGGGRVAAFEILLGTPAVANLIREGKTEQLISVMQMGRGLGMQTMNEHFVRLVRAGLVSPSEAYLKSNDKRGLKDDYKKHGIELPETIES